MFGTGCSLVGHHTSIVLGMVYQRQEVYERGRAQLGKQVMHTSLVKLPMLSTDRGEGVCERLAGSSHAPSMDLSSPLEGLGGQGEHAEKTLVEANYNSVNHITGGFTFTECEEMGDDQPKRCDTCLSCTKCSFRG